jgi:hypothetical protein
MPFIFKISVKTNNMLVYNKISNYEEEIFDCCTDTPDNDTPGSDCCSDAWVKDLAKVSGEYKTISALVSQKQVEYDLAIDWKVKLRAWCDDWEATDEKADALCRQLELFIKHLHRVCKITEKTVHAVKILFCMAEDLYKRTDELKAEYDKLVQCINCLKRPELAPGKRHHEMHRRIWQEARCCDCYKRYCDQQYCKSAGAYHFNAHQYLR